jgi:hypothetical protein
MLVNQKWPVIIVADGASTQESSEGTLAIGLGGRTATHAVASAAAYLEAKLPAAHDLEEVLHTIRMTFEFSQGWLFEAGDHGASTLLMAVLWNSGEEKGPSYWCYGYEGDGVVTLLSRKRVLDTIELSERLLSPQKVEHTAVLTCQGVTVDPAVGARISETGDLLYIGSDGLAPLNTWCRKVRNETFDYFMSTRPGPERLVEGLRQCPFEDDAVIGVISTEPRHVIPKR